jgi:pimeloyl-ACP methyl ester carboxylesterase
MRTGFFSLVLAGAWLVPVLSPPAAERPVVLLLHGRGVTGLDSASLRRDWRDALNMGLLAAGAVAMIREGDLRLVWYADALDTRATAACPSDTGRAPTSEVAAGMATAGALLGLMADWMGQAEATALRSLAGDLAYLGDPGARCTVEDRLGRALAAAAAEGRPVVLIAHSFGALVSYHHLRTRPAPAPRVERYVTIGSLLGRPELRQLLLGAEGREGVSLPDSVGSWVNVRDPDDPLATAVHPARAERAGDILDVTTERSLPGDSHDAARYLADPATARAVLGGWCAALSAGIAGERSCSILQPRPSSP